MCKMEPGENGVFRARFGAREWIGLIAISLATVTAASTLMWLLVGLRIELALAHHTVTPHPVTNQRLMELEHKAP